MGSIWHKRFLTNSKYVIRQCSLANNKHTFCPQIKERTVSLQKRFFVGLFIVQIFCLRGVKKTVNNHQKESVLDRISFSYGGTHVLYE